jgi:tetratricopeptide (TPR) repeat protein
MLTDLHLSLRVLGFCLLIVAICYANSISNPFLQDDLLIVSGNPEIRHVAPLHLLTRPYSQDPRFGGTYRPLTILSFSIDYWIWGNTAAGFRFTNLLLHALNGCLVFALAGILLESQPAAWAAAALYLLHPVHTEAVAGIVGRGELLAAAFVFAAWLLFRNGYTWWAAISFLFALLAKETAITFPAVMALDVFLLQGGRKALFRTWRRFIVLALTAAAYLGIRLWVLGGLFVPKTSQYVQGSLSAVERFMTTGRVFLQYFKLILAPVNVVGVYEFYSIPTATVRDWIAWAGLLAVAVIILCACAVAKRWPIVSFLILFFFLTLLPMSNWIVPIGAIMAERFLYVPSFGFALLAALIWISIPNRRVQVMAGFGVVIVAIMLCVSHNYVWRDDFTFYGNMVRVFPNNMSGRLGYGYAVLDRGRLGEAVEQFEAAHRIVPMSPRVLAQVAGTIVRKDPAHCEQVRPLLDGAFKEQTNHWESYWVLANCSASKRRWEEADAFYRLAATYMPWPNADLLFSWGAVLEALGKKPQAAETYEHAWLANPDDLEIRRKLDSLK